MKKKSFVIGIDGGGTKTSAILADLSGKMIMQETVGPTNFQIIGVEPAVEVLMNLIESVCSKTGCDFSDVEAVVAGLSGAGRPSDQQMMKENLIQSAKKMKLAFGTLQIESDARIALEGAFKGESGIVLIGGTGSICFAKTVNGTILRVGGWGRLISDEGSAHAIGREGLALVAKEFDGRGRKTELTRLLREKFNWSTQEDILHAVYRGNFDIASLAPLVMAAAQNRDSECERIINHAAFELAEHVRAITIKMETASRGLRKKIPLTFLGGMFESDTIYAKIIRNKIEFSLPQITVVEPKAPPAYGAVIMALKSSLPK